MAKIHRRPAKPRRLFESRKARLEHLEGRWVVGSLLISLPGATSGGLLADAAFQDGLDSQAGIIGGKKSLQRSLTDSPDASGQTSSVPRSILPVASSVGEPTAGYDGSGAGTATGEVATWQSGGTTQKWLANYSQSTLEDDQPNDLGISMLAMATAGASGSGESGSGGGTPSSSSSSGGGDGGDGSSNTPSPSSMRSPASGSEGADASGYASSPSSETSPSTPSAPASPLESAPVPSSNSASSLSAPPATDGSSESASPGPAPQASPPPPAGEPFVLGKFPQDLADWPVENPGGSATGGGNVVVVNGDAVIREGDSFVVTIKHSFKIPDNTSSLSFTYTDLFLDPTDTDSINDAFEAALVDPEGRSLVHTFSSNRDAFFNVTEGLSPAVGAGTTHNAGTVTVDLTDVLAGESATLVFRLVNNDSDTGSTVRITGVPTSEAPPVVLTATDLTGVEGQNLAFSGTFSDAGVQNTHTATIYWGDGTSSTGQVVESGGQGTVTADHVYLEDGVYAVRLDVTDDGGTTGSRSAEAHVQNEAPLIAPISPLSGHEGIASQFVASFSDPGILDTGTFPTVARSV